MNTEQMINKDPVFPERGRKTLYSAELRDTICDLVAEGASWRTIVARGIVSQRTVANWLQTIPEFRYEYILAKEVYVERQMSQMDLLVESLASAATQMEVNAIKVCIDTLKWKISRFYPRVYGIGLGHETACPAPDSQYDMSLLTDGEVRELRLLLTKCLAKKEDS